MTEQLLPFKISSGLKNIIGRDLITDDFIAVFELVKNSYDAYATEVTISFEQGKIKIEDDGKGMDLEDIKNKWLFVAYSAKKEGVEDQELNSKEFKSYRDNIIVKKYFAGAKGIGRFSCDRLGGKLILTTKKATENSKIEQIEINWDDFEKDSQKGFLDIRVKHRTIETVTPELKKFKHGTILEIYRLNTSWERQKKIHLRQSLEKLINPFEEITPDAFRIIIEDEREKPKDKEEKDPRYRVNGEVKNFVFEMLDLKTTQVITEIDEAGEYITISIRDRGTFVYKIRKRNLTHPRLSNIKFNLFYLNRAAKLNFSRLMGIPAVHFGSIFVYKNGIRIAPYGDYGVDYFGIDSRHTQGLYRTLGLRDIVGRIEIQGENPNFMEISSRDGGLVKNGYYRGLIDSFIEFCLAKLEKYVINVQWSIKADKDEENTNLINRSYEAKSRLINLINNEIKDEDSELESVDTNFLNLRTKELLKEARSDELDKLKFIADKLGNKTFEKEVNKTEQEHKKLLELEEKLRKEAEERTKIEEEKKKLEEQLETEKEKNTYLRTSTRSLSDDAKGLVHNIKITTRIINSNVDTLYDRVKSGKLKDEEILRRLGTIKFNSEKVLKISKLITRSNFKAQRNEQYVDIVKYINQYIEVYSDIYDKSELHFEVIDNGSSYEKKISVLDLSVILDDLISNSEKAKAKKVLIEISNPNSKSLKILFSDNGNGVPDEFVDSSEEIFELGVTTTDGSGIGLHSVRAALESMGGTIKFVGNGIPLKGASFEIRIK